MLPPLLVGEFLLILLCGMSFSPNAGLAQGFFSAAFCLYFAHASWITPFIHRAFVPTHTTIIHESEVHPSPLT